MRIHNLCTSCGKDFGSVVAFDAHRVGKHAYLYAEGLSMSPSREDGRRCLDTEEMLSGAANGLRFVQTAKGTWSRVRDIERGKMLRHIAGRAE